jgi:hypothetical protein
MRGTGSTPVLRTGYSRWCAAQQAYLCVDRHRLPTWPDIRSALAATWPIVSGSYIPLLALVAARLVGASPSNAANAAAVGLLMIILKDVVLIHLH